MAAYVLLLVLATGSAASPLATRLPRLEAKAADGRLLVLPDSAAGSIALVGFGYRRDSHDELSSWLVPFMKEYRAAEGFRTYEIPMMGQRIPGLLRGLINTAMRNATPKDQRRSFAPYYGDIDDYSGRLAIADRDKAHVFLIDRTGIVQWRAAGRADSVRLAGLRLEVARLAMSDN